MSHNYCLYVHVNRANGKKYYGITSQRPTSRWNHGRGYRFNQYFSRAIQKYGWDSGFEHCVLLTGLSKQEAEAYEKLYIREMDTTNPAKGYNIASGGASCSGWKMTDTQREQLKQRLASQFDTPEKRKEWGNKHRGRHVSQETKDKIRNGRFGKNNPAARKVYCEITNRYFDTIREAAQCYGIKSPSKIGDCCRGKIQYAYKLPNGEKLVWRYVDE